MLESLHGQASVRKLQLFAAACCRRVWPLLDEGSMRRAVETAELFTEGRITRATLTTAAEEARVAALATIDRWYGPVEGGLDPDTVSSWHPAFTAAVAVAGATSTRRFAWVATYAA